MDYKLIAIDMDGTLLNDKQKISSKNLEVIRKVMDNGTKVVLCSGRAYDGVIGSAKEIGFVGSNQYMIYFGGSIIQDYAGHVLYQKTLKNEECRSIDQFLTDHKVKFDLIDNRGTHYDGYQDWVESHMLNGNLGIVKFLLKTHKRKLDALANLIHTTFDLKYFVVKTSDKELEIFPKNVNKGIAIRFLMKYLKINSEQVMAIGDMDNDLPMLKIAGLSVAMGNSPENIKSVSDYVTLDNNHSGVAEAISKFALKKVVKN